MSKHLFYHVGYQNLTYSEETNKQLLPILSKNIFCEFQINFNIFFGYTNRILFTNRYMCDTVKK